MTRTPTQRCNFRNAGFNSLTSSKLKHPTPLSELRASCNLVRPIPSVRLPSHNPRSSALKSATMSSDTTMYTTNRFRTQPRRAETRSDIKAFSITATSCTVGTLCADAIEMLCVFLQIVHRTRRPCSVSRFSPQQLQTSQTRRPPSPPHCLPSHNPR